MIKKKMDSIYGYMLCCLHSVQYYKTRHLFFTNIYIESEYCYSLDNNKNKGKYYD